MKLLEKRRFSAYSKHFLAKPPTLCYDVNENGQTGWSAACNLSRNPPSFFQEEELFS